MFSERTRKGRQGYCSIIEWFTVEDSFFLFYLANTLSTDSYLLCSSLIIIKSFSRNKRIACTQSTKRSKSASTHNTKTNCIYLSRKKNDLFNSLIRKRSLIISICCNDESNTQYFTVQFIIMIVKKKTEEEKKTICKK